MAKTMQRIDTSQAVAVYDSFWALARALRDGTLPDRVSTGNLIGNGGSKFLGYSSILVDPHSEVINHLYDAVRPTAEKLMCDSVLDKLLPENRKNVVETTVLATVTLWLSHMNYILRFNGKQKAIMPLDYYIRNGGDCEAFSLTAAALLQRLKEDGYLEGSMSVHSQPLADPQSQ